MNRLILLLFTVLLLYPIFGQSSNDLQSFSSTSKRSLDDLHKEVFQSLEAFPLNKEMSEKYQEKLNRIYFTTLDKIDPKNSKHLSSVPLLNKINPNLTYDQGKIKLENFNPLKYGFMFYETYDQYILIDESEIVIIIKAFNK